MGFSLLHPGECLRRHSQKTLPEFTAWLDGIKDRMTQRRLATRLRKATLANLGDTKPVAEGVWEMREFFGPGWRMYYVQQADIKAAIALSKNLKESDK